MRDENRPAAAGLVVLLSRLTKQSYRRCTEDLIGIQLRHLVTLSYLHDHNPAHQQELVDALCMDANNVVLLLNELEDLDYVARRRDPHDRRRHLVELTDAGRKALISAEGAQQPIEEEVFASLTPSERTTLWELLTRALKDVEPERSDAQDGADYSATSASIST